MDFLSGLATGLQGMPEEIARAQQQHRLNLAARALANSDFSNVGGDQQQPPVSPHPAAALAALGGGPKPIPAPAMAQGQPPAPQPAAQPMQPPPPQPDPNLSATAQPGVNFDNPIREANQTWQSIINSIKQANPGIDPRTLIAAAQQQLENIKGVAPLTKSIMQGQIQAQKLQFDWQYRSARLQQLSAKLEIDLKNANTREAAEKALEEYHDGLREIGQERADAYSQSVEYGHEDRRAATAERAAATTQTNRTRESVAQGHDETQEDIAGQRSSDSQYRSDQSFRGSQVRSGGQAGPTPQPRRGIPPDARKAPDGHYYAKRGGRYVRFD